MVVALEDTSILVFTTVSPVRKRILVRSKNRNGRETNELGGSDSCV